MTVLMEYLFFLQVHDSTYGVTFFLQVHDSTYGISIFFLQVHDSTYGHEPVEKK
jgi:hypothetical protein